MTKSKNSTSAGRRAFLSSAARCRSLGRGRVDRSPRRCRHPWPRSIFAAIEAHKAASVAVHASVSVHAKLESELPREKRRSRVDAVEEKIAASDDPRWIESERGVMRSFDTETDAACALVSVRPTTIAGVLALLQYANTADTDGQSMAPRSAIR